MYHSGSDKQHQLLDNFENNLLALVALPVPDKIFDGSFHERLGTGGQLAHNKGTSKHIYKMLNFLDNSSNTHIYHLSCYVRLRGPSVTTFSPPARRYADRLLSFSRKENSLASPCVRPWCAADLLRVLEK